MEDFIIKPRARRRSYLEQIRALARRKAQKSYDEQFKGSYHVKRPFSYQQIYTRLMRDEGHWMDGGCWRLGCWCKKHGQNRRFGDKRANYLCDLHYQEWENGDLE